MKRFSWESGFDKPRVLGYLAACRKIDADGRVSFGSYEYQFWLPVLESAVRVHEDVGQQVKHHCILQAVNDATLTLKDCAAFLERCEAAYERLAARPRQKFVVISSMTYAGEPLFSRVVDGDVRIQWQPKPSSHFMRKHRKRGAVSPKSEAITMSQTNLRTVRILSHMCRPMMFTTAS
jgi:hypothetical protein